MNSANSVYLRSLFSNVHCLDFLLFLDLSEVKRALEAELQKCNSSCKESLQNYVANMSTNADFQQVCDQVK